MATESMPGANDYGSTCRYELSCLCLVLVVVGCGQSSPQLDVVTFTGPTMGTQYTVRLVEQSNQVVPDWQSMIDARLAEVNRLMSTYDPQSELSRFNASRSNAWFELSRETAEVIAYSLEVAKDTDGVFDPTVGPLVNLWGFGPDPSSFKPPLEEEILETLELVGYQKLEIRLTPPGIRKLDPEVYLDLSAVAKGYGVDAVSKVLEAEGVTDYMVEIGGEINTLGAKPNGDPWRIGVESPNPGDTGLQAVLELRNQAVASSGDYRNFFVHEGNHYSHTINPRTGKPVNHALATVTVLAATCREADALATALLVMGPEAGYDWAEEQEVAALFVSRKSDTEYTERVTTGWRNIGLEVEKAK